MNADGRPEIVSRESVVFQKFEEAVRIYEWDGETLAQTFSSGYSLGFFDDVRIENVDDRPETLELVIGDRWAYGQAVATAVIELIRVRPVEEIYGWDGEGYEHAVRDSAKC